MRIHISIFAVFLFCLSSVGAEAPNCDQEDKSTTANYNLPELYKTLVEMKHKVFPLDGSWTRVADGCEELPETELKKLAESAGGNSMQRRMVLNFDGLRFSLTTFASAKCDKDFVAKGIQLLGSKAFCDPDFSNEGAVEFLENQELSLHGEKKPPDYNPWGDPSTKYQYEINHDVLIMRDNLFQCPPGTKFKIYFIRTPAS